jgi:hypothetical protein
MVHRPQHENRQSRRFAVGDVVAGELILADRSRLPVRLIDQSADGFAVLTHGPPPLGRGDVVQFQTDDFLCEVRVAHMTEIRLGNEDGDKSDSEVLFHLGLKRLRDLSIASDEQQQRGRQIRWRVVPQGFHSSLPAIILGMLAVAVILAVFFGILRSSPSAQPEAKSPIDPPVATGNALAKRDALSNQAESSKGPTPAPPRPSVALDLKPDDLKRLPGALPFVIDGVARELQLRDAQLEAIRHIIDDTDQTIAKNEESRALLDASRQRVLGLLDPQQRRRWAAMNRAATPSTKQDQPPTSAGR